jgi:redox-sensing transcriptional repressor
MIARRIPDETIKRLPMYLRALTYLPDSAQGNISSERLATFMNTNSAQIRKDFSYSGALGTRGIGYNIEDLIKQIRHILKIDKTQKAALVGAGRLGTAISSFPGFDVYGFDIAAIFDNSPKKIGKKINGRTVQNVSRLAQIKAINIKLAIIAVPPEAAQEVADKLVKAGVKGIVNLSPCFLKVPKKVKVFTDDIAMSLATLPYYL